MANFNEKINCGIEYILNSQGFCLYKSGTIKEFARMIHDDLYLRTNTYCLFIQYKTTHRSKKMAGRCFLWDNSHGDHMSDPGNGIELRSLNDASQDDCEGFGNPRFDDVSAAIFISDQCVFVYGDVQIDANDISKDKTHVICYVSLCGSIVSFFRIPAEAFEHFFGKENFPKQYEKVFGKKEDAKHVQEENDLIEESKRSVELCEMLKETPVWNVGRLKRIEEAFDIINAYTIDLYYLSIQNKVDNYVDFAACWACLDDLKCAYREIVEKIDIELFGISE